MQFLIDIFCRKNHQPSNRISPDFWKVLGAARFLKTKLDRHPSHDELTTWVDYLVYYGFLNVEDYDQMMQHCEDSWSDILGDGVFVSCAMCGKIILADDVWATVADDNACSQWCERELYRMME